MLKPQVHRNHFNSPFTYSSLMDLQEQAFERIKQGGAGALFIAEVAPVITLGRRATCADLSLDPKILQNSGIEVLSTPRGGLATYHGPGQWVVFAVDSLERLTGHSRGVRTAVCGLLKIAQTVAKSCGISAEIREGAEMGLWSSGGGKLASVGVQIREGILLHGLCINGFKTSTSFLGLSKPCGLDAPVDYLFGEGSHSQFDGLPTSIEAAAHQVFWL